MPFDRTNLIELIFRSIANYYDFFSNCSNLDNRTESIDDTRDNKLWRMNMKFKPDLQSFKLAFKPLVLTSIQNGDERVAMTWRKIGSKRSSKRLGINSSLRPTGSSA